MAKYHTTISQDEKYADIIEALDNISNEQAEANRLKRIEIKLKVHELNMTSLDGDEGNPTILEDSEADEYYKQLEDQA